MGAFAPAQSAPVLLIVLQSRDYGMVSEMGRGPGGAGPYRKFNICSSNLGRAACPYAALFSFRSLVFNEAASERPPYRAPK